MEKPIKAVAAASQPIADNRHVKELLSVMEASKAPEAADFLNLISYVGQMEQHLANMVKEVSTMRAELAEAQRQNHPVKTALQKAVIVMQGNILELRDKLNTLKQDIVKGCRDTLSAVREKGLSALRGVAGFFKLRPALEAVRGNIETAIREDDKAISRIETASAEYHKAGRAIKNIARAAVGIETIAEPKQPGNLAKTLQAPLRADRACLRAMGRCVSAAIGAVGRLEKTERKPPIMETIDKLDAEIKAAQRVTPVRVLARPEPARSER